MTRQKTLQQVSQIEEAAITILHYIENMDYEAFKNDLKTQDAVMMRLVSIGELVNRMFDHDVDFVQINPQVPWNMIRGMRNKIAHDYFGIDSRLLFETAKTSIPQLAEMMGKLKK